MFAFSVTAQSTTSATGRNHEERAHADAFVVMLASPILSRTSSSPVEAASAWLSAGDGRQRVDNGLFRNAPQVGSTTALL